MAGYDFVRRHDDLTFREYIDELQAQLPALAAAPNVQAYSQFFEVYSEALVLEILRTKVRAERVPRAPTGTPDFRCQLEDRREFYVEVKTLDIVGGRFRHDEIMVDAIDQAAELQKQIAEGRAVVVSEGEIAPYKPSGESGTYDPRSVICVIDTLREKWVQAFKADQFKLGPTLALAVTDRLGPQTRRSELAPYYVDKLPGPACISGTLWHAAFGMPGTPIFRPPNFEGGSNMEGHLAKPGIFVDVGRPFPGLALISLGRTIAGDLAYGLYSRRQPVVDGWTTDDTRAALAFICEAFNDDGNSYGHAINAPESA